MLLTAFLLFAVVILYLAGPKVDADTSFTVLDLPQNLDAYLKESEAKFSDIIPGAEKVIHWADPERREKTPLAFIYFHGFSATRQESMPVPELIAKHFKSNIFYTRLTGNGRTDAAMAEGSVNTWVNDASEAMAVAAELGERTIIIGCSTGASLGWWATHQEQFNAQVDALVFFSPNFGLADPRANLLTVRWGKQIAEAILGKCVNNEARSEIHARYWSQNYPTEALLPMMRMVKIARRIAPRLCNKPVFILYSLYDDTVDANKIQKLYQRLKCRKKIISFDNPDATSQHVVVGDILAPQNNDRAVSEVIDFLEENVRLPQ